MPFHSKSQMRAIAAKESAGELPPGTFAHWRSVTPDIKALPERLHKKRTEKMASDKPYAAMIVAVTKDGDFIASTRPKDKRSHAGEIGLVGGKLEPGESARQAAIREAGEEGWEVGTVSKQPIHHSNHNGKVVAIFSAAHAKAKHNHKEKHREVYPVTVTQEELAKSHPANDFVAMLDPENLKAGVEKEAGWASKAFGAAAIGFHALAGMGGHVAAPIADIAGAATGMRLARTAMRTNIKDSTKTMKLMRAGGQAGDGGFKPPQQLLSGTPHTAPALPQTGFGSAPASGFDLGKTASLTGLCEKLASNSISKVPPQPLPPPTQDQQIQAAASEKAQAMAQKNISAPPPVMTPRH